MREIQTVATAHQQWTAAVMATAGMGRMQGMGRTRAAEVAGMAVMEAIRSCSETSRRQAAVAVVSLVVMLSSCQGGAVVVVRMALAQSLPEAEIRQSWMEVMAAAAMVKGCPEPGASSHLSSASAAAAAMALVEGGAGVGWATESPDRLFHIMTIACLKFWEASRHCCRNRRRAHKVPIDSTVNMLPAERPCLAS